MPTTRYSTLLIGGATDEGELSLIEKLKSEGLRVDCIDEMRRDINPIQDIKALIAVYRVIRKEKPNIVCTHTAKAGAIGRTAALLAGVPHLFHTFHGHVFENYFPKPLTFLFLTIERILARFTDRIVAISPAQLYDLAEKYRVAPSRRFQVIRLGFELEELIDLKHSPALKRHLGLADDRILIGVVGRLAPIKNHLSAMRILQELIRHDDRFHLCIVGDGTERPALEAFCQQNELKSHVHFMGWANEMAAIYAGLDLLLLTSLNEGTPVTIIEAMAAGVPVVSSQVGGVPDLICEGQNGFMFPLNDESKAVEKILIVAQNELLRKQIVEQARNFVRSTYSYQRLIDEMDVLYQHHLQKTF